jgi:hypothetical protein
MSRLLYHLSYTAEWGAPGFGRHPVTGSGGGVVAAAGFEPATFGL